MCFLRESPLCRSPRGLDPPAERIPLGGSCDPTGWLCRTTAQPSFGHQVQVIYYTKAQTPGGFSSTVRVLKAPNAAPKRGQEAELLLPNKGTGDGVGEQLCPLASPTPSFTAGILPRACAPSTGCSGWAGGSGCSRTWGAAPRQVQTLQHPTEHRVGEQLCGERRQLELRRKHILGAKGALGTSTLVLLLTRAQGPRVGVGAEPDDGALGGQAAGAAVGKGTSVLGKGSRVTTPRPRCPQLTGGRWPWGPAGSAEPSGNPARPGAAPCCGTGHPAVSGVSAPQ